MPTLILRILCTVGFISERILAPVWAGSLTCSSVGQAAPVGGELGLSLVGSVQDSCRESLLSTSVVSDMLWQQLSFLLSPSVKEGDKITSLLCFVIFRKYFHKQEGFLENKFILSDIYRLVSKRYCYRSEELTQADLLEVIHVSSRSVLFMSIDYMVLFILENPFFFWKLLLYQMQ